MDLNTYCSSLYPSKELDLYFHELGNLRAQKVMHRIGGMKSVQPEIGVDWYTTGWVEVGETQCAAGFRQLCLKRRTIAIAQLRILGVGRTVRGCVQASCRLLELLRVVKNSSEKPIGVKKV